MRNLQHHPVTLGLVISKHDLPCAEFPLFYLFIFPTLCSRAHPKRFFLGEFQPVGSNIPREVRLYDLSAMYNKEQCKPRSISCSAYKVIVPSGLHLAKRRLCWDKLLPHYTSCRIAPQQKQHITVIPYCPLVCIYMFRMCRANQLAFH